MLNQRFFHLIKIYIELYRHLPKHRCHMTEDEQSGRNKQLQAYMQQVFIQ